MFIFDVVYGLTYVVCDLTLALSSRVCRRPFCPRALIVIRWPHCLAQREKEVATDETTSLGVISTALAQGLG
jgi:hypothetical protein